MEHSIMVDVELREWKCFPTTVYTFKSIESVFQEHENMIVDIKTCLKENAKVNKRNTRVNLLQTEPDLHNLPSFKQLSIFVSQLCSDALIQEGYEKQKIEITQMWANRQTDGSHHPPHTHGNSILSGIYYIKSTDNSAKTQFFDPKIQAHRFKPRREKSNWDNSSMIEFSAVTGTGLIFPSWLSHWTPINTDERISISWNILVRGNYGEPGTLQNAYI